MLQFHEQIITDLLEDPTGGLVVISTGLGLQKLIASLLTRHDPSQGTLLILSATPSQKSSTLSSLDRNPSSDEDANMPSEITSDLPANSRLFLYNSGNAFFITSRILIVDLLTSRLPVTSVAGLIILNAHLLSETSTEAFIVRILRSSNKSLYIRAFSDKPNAMVSGFAKVERTLKCLYLRKLHLWPRFHVYVSQDLERDPPEVVDLRVPMTANMRGIQKAVIEVMDACLKEMRRTNKVDVEDLTVENGLFKSFDEIVRRQLDPIWHTLGKKTKQLVSDLRTLRKLLDYLVRYDAVTYLKFLDSLRVSENFRSVWIFAESSYKIFELAKKRVYRFGRSHGGDLSAQKKTVAVKKRKLKDIVKEKNDSPSENTSSEVVLEEVLEVPPKWKMLREVLKEIEEERQKQVTDKEDNNNGIVLVVCKDERSCMQLENFIMNGPHKVMRDEWENYLLSKVEVHALPKHNYKKKSKDPKGFGILNGIMSTTSGQNAEPSSLNKQENDLLIAAATKLRKQKDVLVVDDPISSEPIKGCGRGKKKGSNKSAIMENQKTSAAGSRNEADTAAVDNVDEGLSKGLPTDCCVLRKHSDDLTADSSKDEKLCLPIHFYAIESDQHILDVLMPSVIIAYHPDMAFVREVEIYKAGGCSSDLKVYFLFYDESTEVQKFEASIRRENGAFESLIRQKSMMTIPVDQDGKCLGPSSSVEPESIHSQNLVTRKAGGRKEVEKETQVIVDMREFMSSLPNVLHQKGMRIIPVTLEVGDYILSPSICVERKSIQDLFGSFSSGRLYHQVEAMVRYYRIPVLLIEFSQDKSFSFQSASDIGDDVTPNNIISKLSLLALHFPRLRIVWSRSLHATAEIFSSLKANQDEPDESKAIRVGVPSEEGIIENDVRAEIYNTSAMEFLRRLPGVTDSNYRVIMDNCNSLSELSMLPVERLAELMDGLKAAKTLRDFLDAKYPTLH
ncbi:DNA repair endonuclease UVH1 [Impatiens glandulifera]|uniref:DNA repair endonuclease UVH1 n=1 Tax=Impatiens glandulifera TaxID=253017 RepID=UPI001FB1660D|nr:DNA repair endonuclease UVH1 [Impatiens glandulifera]